MVEKNTSLCVNIKLPPENCARLLARCFSDLIAILHAYLQERKWVKYFSVDIRSSILMISFKILLAHPS